jgi:hypothetical protein
MKKMDKTPQSTQGWWYISEIPAFGRRGKRIVGSRLAWVMEANSKPT